MTDIRLFLIGFGFNPKLTGFIYLEDLLSLSFERQIFPLGKYGYKLLSEKYRVSAVSIEKNIQYAIEAAFSGSKSEKLYGIFGETIDEGKGKPTNKHFIFSIIETLKQS